MSPEYRFKPGRGTMDTMFIVRQIMKKAKKKKKEKSHTLPFYRL